MKLIGKIAALLLLGVALSLSSCSQSAAPVEESSDLEGQLSFGVVSIFPTSRTVVVNKSMQFDAEGGERPYLFSIVSGEGSIDSSSGLFTAAAMPGDVAIRVTDNSVQTADASVKVVAAVEISPSTKNILAGETVAFSASNGILPYTFSLVIDTAGGSTIDAAKGVFTAPAGEGMSIVKVTDAIGDTSLATVRIGEENSEVANVSGVQISPVSENIVAGGTVVFQSSGGRPPYRYSILSGGGKIDPVYGILTAPDAEQEVLIGVIDSLKLVSVARVRVKSNVSIAPASVDVAVKKTCQFAASGGLRPYVFSKVSGEGTIDPATGVFTAPVVEADKNAVVKVTDALGSSGVASIRIIFVNNAPSFEKGEDIMVSSDAGAQSIANWATSITAGLNESSQILKFTVTNDNPAIFAAGAEPLITPEGTLTFIPMADDADGMATVTVKLVDNGGVGNGGKDTSEQTFTITVYPVLEISPASVTISRIQTVSFEASSGGVEPFTYSVDGGRGSFNGDVFTPPSDIAPPVNGVSQPENIRITVTDKLGNTKTSVVTVMGQGLDPTFGVSHDGKMMGNGEVLPGVGGFDVKGAVLLPDGDILIAGQANRLEGGHWVPRLMLARFNSDGSPDDSFGTRGYVETLNTLSDVVSVSGNSIVYDPERNRVYVAGLRSDAPYVTCGGEGACQLNVWVQAFDAGNGSLVTTFGQDQVDGRGPMAKIDWNTGYYALYHVRLAVQSDGKVIVGANDQQPAPIGRQFAVARLLIDGTFDETFGINGRNVATTGGGAWLGGMALRDDGEILMSGFCCSYGKNSLTVLFDTNGLLDQSFGGAGKIVTGTLFSLQGETDEVGHVAVGGDNKYTISGVVNLGGTGVPVGTREIFLAAYDANGARDTTFAANGAVKKNIRTLSTSYNVRHVVLPNENIAVMGTYFGGTASPYTPADFSLLVFDRAAKNWDPNFESDKGGLTVGIGDGNDYAREILAMPGSGRIIIVGTTEIPGSRVISMARFWL